MTDVFVLKNSSTPLADRHAELLPRWRRRRLERLRYAPAREASFSAGLLWRYVMEKHGLQPEEPVRFLQAGKPVFAEREDYYFSLSHSGPYAMCAISNNSVGVDIQRIKPVHMSVARRFHFRERDWLAEHDPNEQNHAFYELWTRKEAWVKATSKDQLLNLNEQDVIHGVDGWQFVEYSLEDEYMAAVCARIGEKLTPPTVLTPEDVLQAIQHPEQKVDNDSQ